VNKKSRAEHLESLLGERRTMIFYEAPHKLAHTLQDFYAAFGDRKLTIARELTKVHEQIIRTTTREAAEKYADGTLKGEIVLVLEGKKTEEKSEITLSDAVAYAQKLIDGGMRPTEAAKQAARKAHFSKDPNATEKQKGTITYKFRRMG
jgi:16S rRNA (cytidine1402-2'-O)-methyltransferase